jgi:hypothetical protein
MVSVLVIGPKVRVFMSGRHDSFLTETKIRNTPSFGGKLKPSTPCRKILRHVKSSTSLKEIFCRLNPLFPSPRSSFDTRWLCR